MPREFLPNGDDILQVDDLVQPYFEEDDGIDDPRRRRTTAGQLSRGQEPSDLPLLITGRSESQIPGQQKQG